MTKRILSILLALVLALSVTTVFAEGVGTAEAVETEEAAAQAPDTLLVTVNGTEIRENNEEIQSYLLQMGAFEEGADASYVRIARMYAVENAIYSVLLEQKKASLFTEEEREEQRKVAREAWDAIVTGITEQQFGITADSTEDDKAAARADALSMLEAYYGYTEEVYVEGAIEDAFYARIQEELIAAHPDIVPTEEEIQQYYEELVGEEMDAIGNDAAMYEFYQMYQGYEFHYVPEGYKGILHILLMVDEGLLNNWMELRARFEESQETAESTGDAEGEPAETEEPVTAEMVEAARQAVLDSQKEKLDAIRERLANGEAFETLIAEYGEDSGMQDPETLAIGYSVHPDSITYDVDFTEGAAALEKVGDVSDPVVSSFGIHILYYLRDVPAGPLPMTDDVKNSIRSTMESEGLQLYYGEMVEQWEAEADIVWTAEGEPWKYDQTVVDAYIAMMDGEDDDDDEDEADVTETDGDAEAAEPEAEPEAEAAPEAGE